MAQQLKFLVFGPEGSGKATFMTRAGAGESDDLSWIWLHEGVSPEITIDDQKFSLELQLAPCEPSPRPLLKAMIRAFHGCIIIFSLTDRQAFETIQSCCDDIRSLAEKEPYLIICGNKNDLVTQRSVDEMEGEALAQQSKAQYFEISALKYADVKRVLEGAVRGAGDILKPKAQPKHKRQCQVA